MRIGDSFRRAYEVVARNWPLVIINIVSSVVMLVLFVLLVILPISSLTGTWGFHYRFDNPGQLGEFLSGAGLKAALTGCGLFLFWALVASVIGIYIYAGAVGVMKETFLRQHWQFTLRAFLREANAQFWPVMGFLGVLFLLGIALAVAWALFFALLAIGGSAFKDVPQGGLAVVVSVLGVFLFIAVAVVMLAMMLIFTALGAYGTTVVVFRDASVWGALKRAWKVICGNKQAFWGFVLSLCVLWLVAIGLGIGGLIVEIIPGIGRVLALPYNVFSLAVEVFATYWSTAVAMSFYAEERTTLLSQTH